MLLLNDKPVENFKFPGGELQVTLPNNLPKNYIKLEWKPKNSDDFMLLFMTVNALNEMDIDDIHLIVYYLPYARQDRVCNTGQAFSLKVICNLLNQLNIKTISTFDPHNYDLTMQYMNAHFSQIINASSIFNRYNVRGLLLENINVCYPDHGALTRNHSVSVYFQDPMPIVFIKNRDPLTGKILSLEHATGQSYPETDRNILVVDDICDGGRTFTEVAQKLYKFEPKSLTLYITHGIFSHGLDELFKHYDKIICHHVLDDSRYKSDEKLIILKEFN